MGARGQLVTKAEEAVAAALVRANIRFEYEPKHFRLHLANDRKRGFRPDFYLPEHGVYIEAGSLSSKAHKLRYMRHLYPQIKVVIFDNSWVDALARVDSEELMDWFYEAWVIQEYMDPYAMRSRIKARAEHVQAKIKGVFGPSMRSF